MASLYELYGILLFISGSAAEILLSQKASEIANVGTSILLQCEVSGYNINDHHMHWVRQAPGPGTIEWLAAYRSDTTYISESFKERVTPSTSGSTAQLRISKLSSSDTATYYCATHIEEALCRQCVKSAEKGLQNSVNYPGTILSRKTTHIHKRKTSVRWQHARGYMGRQKNMPGKLKS
ncbi:hypothetical protein XELAEV_18007166mg [Xenopus laevis]|uniref:Ig-like domain-containing protein n=1 Tax=Xenopus laevis TaxID=8355 RepID=A0A974E2G8_XENLA|nr:hypothetical protein XELAEV_18007166mg [Xenopus laevis]